MHCRVDKTEGELVEAKKHRGRHGYTAEKKAIRENGDKIPAEVRQKSRVDGGTQESQERVMMIDAIKNVHRSVLHLSQENWRSFCIMGAGGGGQVQWTNDTKGEQCGNVKMRIFEREVARSTALNLSPPPWPRCRG